MCWLSLHIDINKHLSQSLSPKEPNDGYTRVINTTKMTKGLVKFTTVILITTSAAYNDIITESKNKATFTLCTALSQKTMKPGFRPKKNHKC